LHETSPATSAVACVTSAGALLAKQLAFMRRVARGFINRVLWKAVKKYVRAAADRPALGPAAATGGVLGLPS
jgi:hypothetical protein